MMMMDKKKVLGQIMGDQPEETNPLVEVMKELIHCIDSGDAEGAAACFKSAFAHCGAPEAPQE